MKKPETNNAKKIVKDLAEGDIRSKAKGKFLIQLRLNENLKEAILSEADELGLPNTKWVEMLIRRELKEKGKL